MRLKSSFIRLNCQFDADKLQNEVINLPAEAWKKHPQGFEGNSAVPLVAKNGDDEDDSTYGIMKATQWLDKLPYIRQVLSSLKIPVGRTRLMRIKGKSQVPKHTDLAYYWQKRMRIHVPVITNESVKFECNTESIHMAAGEVWIFDTTQLHRVINTMDNERIHLVIDSVGSDYLFSLFQDFENTIPDFQELVSLESDVSNIEFESYNRPLVMSPFELREVVSELADLFMSEMNPEIINRFKTLLQPVINDWNATWAVYGESRSGLNQYLHLKSRLENCMNSFSKGLIFRGSPVKDWINHWLIEPSIDIEYFNQGESKDNGISKLNQSENEKEISEQPSFNSRYTDSFPALISHLEGTLVATTYASNRVVLLRANGDELNTHFKEYPGAMGLAYNETNMALGVQNGVWLFRSQPDLKQSFQPSCDAVYVPHHLYETGDIRVHELDWSGDELWVVNTRFSCLATLDDEYSFIPQWHPRFISQLNSEDACHLNGMAMQNGKPGWVTALGKSNQPGGWREGKTTGGIIMNVESNEIVATNLCMPHSPRWYNDSLWVLNSGYGELCQVNPETGERNTVVQLPGFTRGLTMIGRYAFIGCSRVRERSWFGGLPILEKSEPPTCGIWAVDLVSSQIIGWLEFDEGIDEIFDIQWLPGVHWPDILETNEPVARNAFVLPENKINKFI